MAEVVSINLDPVNDGVTGTVDHAESTAGRYVVKVNVRVFLRNCRNAKYKLAAGFRSKSMLVR